MVNKPSLLTSWNKSINSNYRMTSIKGKIILVTGGSKGIGFGVAQTLLEEGAKVAITSRTQASANEAADLLKKATHGEVLPLNADVRDYASQQRAVNEVMKTFGRLDVLVANAGLGYFGSIETLSTDQWNETIDTNLTGVFYSVKACVPALKETKGYIITIASLAGTNFFAGGSAYNASKFGLVGFSQAIMLDLRKCGIKVSTIMPGSVATDFGGSEQNANDSWKIQPEDIGQMVSDLLKMNPRTLPSKIEVRPSIPK
jgi:3-oxoacyl-[acyl-carrier protein] reductase